VWVWKTIGVNGETKCWNCKGKNDPAKITWCHCVKQVRVNGGTKCWNCKGKNDPAKITWCLCGKHVRKLGLKRATKRMGRAYSKYLMDGMWDNKRVVRCV
jgi:hypothetical protein